MFFLIWTQMGIAGACCLLILMWPLLHKASPEAERMLTLVKSARTDKRGARGLKVLALSLAARFGALQKKLGVGQNLRRSRRFGEAGWRNAHVKGLFFAAEIILSVTGGVSVGALAGYSSSLMVCGAIGGFFVPDIWLAMRQKARRARIRRSIPDMVDLLVICVGAGLGLDQALLRVGEELNISHSAIAQELERLSLARQAGSSRLDAWHSFAERVHIEELTDFTSMLAETDRFGTPIVKALTEFAEELRLKRRQRAEEAASKTKIKIIFPLVLCIFPCIFIVLLAPALLNIARSFSSLGQ